MQFEFFIIPRKKYVRNENDKKEQKKDRREFVSSTKLSKNILL